MIDNQEILKRKEKIKQAANKHAKKILDYFGIQGFDSGPYFQSRCPIPYHPGDRTNDKAFSWSFDQNIWACWSHHCHVRCGNDIIGLISALTSSSFLDSLVWLYEFLTNRLELSKEAIDVEQPRFQKELKNKVISENRLSLLRKDRRSLRYLLSRGFPYQLLRKFEIGYWFHFGTFMHNRVVIPIRDFDTRLVGFTGRTVFPKEEWPKRGIKAKWVHGADFLNAYQSGFRGSLVLFNLFRAKKSIPSDRSIILVEGPLDGLRLTMAGFDNWCACLGSHLTSFHKTLLIRAGVRRVLLCFDGDLSGQSSSDRLENKLSDLFEVKNVQIPTGYDPGDLSSTTLKRIIKECYAR